MGHFFGEIQELPLDLRDSSDEPEPGEGPDQEGGPNGTPPYQP